MRRIARDLKQLQTSTQILRTVVDETEAYPTFYVTIRGPSSSVYEGGEFTLCCILPKEFPMKSPSVAFTTKIWHPNVEQASGSICLNVLGDSWSPLITLGSVFEEYIPQLLLNPEPKDPFNADAAAMMQRDAEAYNTFARAYTLKYASVSV